MTTASAFCKRTRFANQRGFSLISQIANPQST
jgi:hypothetical protein